MAEPMRILFTTQPASGHLRPLVPLAQAAARRGHQVAVATLDRMSGELAGYGLAHLPAGYDWAPEVVAQLPRGYSRLSFAQAADVLAGLDAMVTATFAGPAARALAHDVLAAQFKPDLVVREADEFGGYLAAEVLGVPHASVASFGGLSGITGQRLAPILDEGRRDLGLPGDPEGAALYRYLHATFLPEAYGAGEFILPNTRAYRHTSSEQVAGRLPGWLAELDHDRPFLFAGFGTVVYDLPGARDFLAEVIAALGMLPVTAVLAVGSGKSLDRFGSLPPNVRLVEFTDQPLMLEGCDLFLSHGGLNSIKEALRLAVPMVGMPVGSDHRHNVATCVRAGVAVEVPVGEAGAATIAAACARVLGDPGYRSRARWLQRHIHALAPIDQLMDDLEELGARRGSEAERRHRSTASGTSAEARPDGDQLARC
ncbi:MAG: glycosyltransferase family 1 protein [Micromonosporaceae bacterium]|nr:glycosyltransferase family 1 protein [Micromonosporaceae bacterium]